MKKVWLLVAALALFAAQMASIAYFQGKGRVALAAPTKAKQ